LKVELDWLKKKLAISVERKRQLVEPAHPRVSLRRPCALLGLARGNLYDQPVSEHEENLQLMRWLDEPYTATPFYGVRRMTAWLRRRGDAVNPKRVRRLLRQMGLAAVYAKPRLSLPAAGQVIYPSLLRGVPVARVNQAWSADITSIRLQAGFVYLVAVIDWLSR
jgi:putative transposase